MQIVLHMEGVAGIAVAVEPVSVAVISVRMVEEAEEVGILVEHQGMVAAMAAAVMAAAMVAAAVLDLQVPGTNPVIDISDQCIFMYSYKILIPGIALATTGHRCPFYLLIIQ